MTPQAKALRAAVAAAVGPGRVDAALRAVVEELGVTEAFVEKGRCRCGYYFAPDAAAIALSALLEASGADHG